MYTDEIGSRNQKKTAVFVCIHAQTHNHLDGFNGWKNEASVHNGLTVPSNSILVDIVFYLILFIYSFYSFMVYFMMLSV